MGHEGAGATAAAEAAVVEGVPVLHVTGEIDMATTQAVRRELLRWLGETPPVAVLDLSGVTFLASSGLALLADAAEHAERSGTRFAVVAAQRPVLQPLKATGMAELFDLHPDVHEAVRAVREAAANTAP